jgi:hypothetical protein
MLSGRIGCELVVLAVFCVLSIFLFPAIQGPYPVVHGPATALLAARTALRLHRTIAQAALTSLAQYLFLSLTVLAWMPFSLSNSLFVASPQLEPILRC